jgi:hypothetical protein
MTVRCTVRLGWAVVRRRNEMLASWNLINNHNFMRQLTEKKPIALFSWLLIGILSKSQKGLYLTCANPPPPQPFPSNICLFSHAFRLISNYMSHGQASGLVPFGTRFQLCSGLHSFQSILKRWFQSILKPDWTQVYFVLDYCTVVYKYSSYST